MNYDWCTKKNKYRPPNDSDNHDTQYCGEDQSRTLNKIVTSLQTKHVPTDNRNTCT